MIQARGLVKRYGSFTAVNGVDLHVLPGEIYGLLGPNGAGKTSTLMMLLGTTRPTSGEVYLFEERRSPARLDVRKRIGMVPEKHPRGVWPWMTAREYLSMFAELFEVDDARRRIESLLERVELREFGGRKIRELSRGMLQKLSFARAILHDPDILFLDEPISGLDPVGIKQVRDLIISENRAGRCVFISSHQLSEMERICDRVGIIARGKILAEDTMSGLFSKVSRTREILVEVERIPPGLEHRVKAIPSVLDCFVQGRSLLVTVPAAGDLRKAISELLIREGLVPLQIQEKARTLEEAFLTITQENVEMLTREAGVRP